tara:strand:+ start:1759 stop:2202 length:444 start_codon:yes stop_codon:yes gene_type:complete
MLPTALWSGSVNGTHGALICCPNTKEKEDQMTTTTRATLVSSSDVNGTEVYSPDGTNVGTIDHLMIDKQSGKVAYAVMAFGGFLGIGEDHRPVPWGKLNYDTNKGGFVSDITPEEVQSAPDRTNDWYADRAWDQRTHDHYQVPYYWI